MSTQKGKTKMYKKETAFNLEGHSVHPTKIQNSKKQKEKCGKLSLTELFNGNTKTSSHQCRKVSTFLVYLQILKCDLHYSFFFSLFAQFVELYLIIKMGNFFRFN